MARTARRCFGGYGGAPEFRGDVGRDRDTHALFLRVHLAPGTDPAALGIPAQVGDLPVQVLFAEYRLR